MKNLKKVLALVVVFTMMLSTVAFAAYPDVAEDADYATAVEVLSALNILKGDDQGNFNPDADITRAEFAAVVCRALGLEDSANGAKGATAFSDVKADHWATGYINLANQMGIINGMGDGTFAPEANVTFEQAVKMLVCSLGFEYMAQTKGGWPTGYLVVANTYGVTAGVKATAGEAAARSVVAELTYNALDAATMEQGTFGTEENWYVYDGISRVKKTLLSEKLDVAKLTGVVIANSKSAIGAGSITEKDEIQFEIKTDVVDKFGSIWNPATGWAVGNAPKFKVADTNAAEYFANQVDIYVTEVSRNVWEVVAITEEVGKNVTTTISTADVDVNKTVTNAATYNVNNNDVFYFKDGARTSTKIEGAWVSGATAVDLLVNNATATWTTYVTGLGSAPAGQIEFIDWDNDYKFDAVIVSEYIHVIVDTVNANAGMIKTKMSSPRTINLKLDDENVNVTIKDTKGNKVALEDIVENDVLAVVADTGNPASWTTNLDIIVIPAEEATVTGTVSETAVANPTAGSIVATDKIYIDGEGYGLAVEDDGGNDIYNLRKLTSINSVGTFYLGIDGRIVGFEGDKAVDGNYAFILQSGLNTTDPVNPNKIVIKALTAEGTIETYTVSDYVTIPGLDATTDDTFDTTTSEAFDAADFTGTAWSAYNGQAASTVLAGFAALSSAGEPAATLKERFVKLSVNSNNVITGILVPGVDGDFKLGADLTSTAKEYRADDMRFEGNIFTDGAKIFVLDSGDNYADSKVKTLGEAFVDEGEYKLAMYNDGAATFDAAIVTEGMAKFASNDGIAIIKSVATTKTADREDAYKITYIQDGTDEVKSITIIDQKTKDITANSKVPFSFAAYNAATAAQLAAGTHGLKAGDVFTYTANDEGNVEAFAVIARLNTTTLKFIDTAYAQNAHLAGQAATTKDVKFYTGYIKNIEGNVVTVADSIHSADFSVSIGGNTNEYYFNKYDANRFDLSAGAYQLGKVDEYDDANNNNTVDAGEARTYVFIKTVDGVATDIYAFDNNTRATN